MARDYGMGEWRSKNNKIEDARITLNVLFTTGDHVALYDVTDFGIHPDGESYYFVKNGYENYIPRRNVVYMSESYLDLPKIVETGVK